MGRSSWKHADICLGREHRTLACEMAGGLDFELSSHGEEKCKRSQGSLLSWIKVREACRLNESGIRSRWQTEKTGLESDRINKVELPLDDMYKERKKIGLFVSKNKEER
jgi:hypothetical protein